MFARLFAPTLEVHAHCDLPCGVYDPAQARIEAESIKGIIAKVGLIESPRTMAKPTRRPSFSRLTTTSSVAANGNRYPVPTT